MTIGDGVALVTGAGGFIGSHLVEELVRRGTRVRAFVRYNARGDRGNLELLPSAVLDEVEIVAGDLRDGDTVERAAQGVGTIFHLGALIAIPYSYRSPRDTIETNILGTLSVLEAARKSGSARVVQTSTSEVYGTPATVPISETHPLQGQSPYAASKIGADQIADSYARSFGLPVAIVRPFNTYGPRQSTRAIVPTIISQALVGATLKLGSLTPTRDLNFVLDTVAGFISVAESERAVGEVINIGSGTETSIGDLVTIVGELVGHELVVEQDAQRLRPTRSEVQRLVADSSKAATLCGWRPTTSLREGLHQTIDWMRANLDRFRPEQYGV